MNLVHKVSIKRIITWLFLTGAVIFFNLLIIGDKYIYRFKNHIKDYKSIEVNVVEDEMVSVESIEVKGDIISVELKGLIPGETQIEFIVFGDDGNSNGIISNFYIHKSGLITEGGYIGTCNNFFVIGIEMAVFLLLIFIYQIISCYKIGKENMYSYSLVFNLGVAIFLFACLVLSIVLSVKQKMVAYRLDVLMEILGIMFWLFSFAALPILFIVSLFLLISNIKLIKQEGLKLSNLLGILLGVSLFILSYLAQVFIALIPTKAFRYSPLAYYAQFFVYSFFGSIPVYIESLMVSTLFCTVRAQKHVPKFDKDYIIILGCSIMDDGTVTPILKERADRALWFAEEQKKKTGKDIIFVASGGQGSDEVISEAGAIKNYLMSAGVDEDHIMVEDKSTNTRENMAFSKRLIDAQKKEAKVAFSTTGYHVFRSGNIARSVGLNADGVGSRTKWYFYFNAIIREFIANITAEKKRHILNIIGLFLYAVIIAFLNKYTN
ncbi:MAG: YdcF family protein [Lachnospiraceae bacterium]|nr:YdcF family protein [Lachnospiraceae bacterium]